MKTHKTNIILLAIVQAVALTALFLVVKATALFAMAYGFALGGIALLCLGRLYLFANVRSYPWLAAFPRTIRNYLFAQITASAIAVLLEQAGIFSLPWQWFATFHVLLFAFFAYVLTMLLSGKEIIERRGEIVKEKTATLRLMQSDVESLMRKFPAHEKDLKPVADALRYSDPMSHPSLAVIEEQIQRGIAAMDNGADIPAHCAELLRQIADRNGRAKVLK